MVLWAQLSRRYQLLLLSIYTVCLVCASYVVVRGRLRSEPQIYFDQRIHDFGTVTPGERLRHGFAVRNRGNAALTIASIRTSCGCAGATINRNVIRPGEAASLSVWFDAPRFSGPVKHRIVIVSNDPHAGVEELFIKAHIVPGIVVEPPVVNFGLVRSDSLPITQAVRILVRNEVKKPLLERPIRVAGADHILVAMSTLEQDGGYLLSVTLVPGAPIGPICGKVRLPFGKEEVAVSVIGRISGDVYAEPSALFWGIVLLGTCQKREVTIVSQDREMVAVEATVTGLVKPMLRIRVDEVDGASARLTAILDVDRQQEPGKRIDGAIQVVICDETGKELRMAIPTTVLVSASSGNVLRMNRGEPSPPAQSSAP